MTAHDSTGSKNKMLEQIAKKHCHVPTLETRKRDSLDFHDVSVCGLKAALEEAYSAGLTKGLSQANKTEKLNSDRCESRQICNSNMKPSVVGHIRETKTTSKEPRTDIVSRDKSEPEH